MKVRPWYEQYFAWRRRGLSKADAAERAGVSRHTAYQMSKTSAEFRATVAATVKSMKEAVSVAGIEPE